MHVEWYGQSAFRLSTPDTTVFIDPIGDVSGLAGRGLQFDYPPVEGVAADLLLVTHEHMDHNGVEQIDGSPAILRSTAGRLQSPLGEVLAVASEHDQAAGTERGPEHDLRVHVRRGPGLRTSATSARLAATRAGRRDRRGRPAVHPRRRRSDDRRAGGGRDRRRARAALDRPDALPHAPDRLPRTRRRVPRADAARAQARDAGVSTGELPAVDGPLVIVPAAP